MTYVNQKISNGVYTKILILLIAGVMVLTATTVFAAKNYNSSKSNSTSIELVNQKIGDILLRYSVGGAEINIVTNSLAVGVSEVDLKATLIKIGIGDEGVSEVFNELDRLGIAINEEGLQAISTLDAGGAAQAVEEIEIAVEKVERGEVSTSGTGDTPQPEVKAKAVLLIKMEDKAISTPDTNIVQAVDSFFDIVYELEVFVEVIAKDANITKAEAKKVVEALMAVSPAFIIDEDGLQDDEEARLIAVVIISGLESELIAKRALDGFVSVTTKSLRGSDRVALVGFGSFSISKRKARTGATVQISDEQAERIKAGADLTKTVARVKYSNIILERGYSAFNDASKEIIQNIKVAAPEERKNLIEELKVNRKTLQTEILSMSLSTQENANALRKNFRDNMITTIGHVDHGKTAKIIVAHGKSLRMLTRYDSAIARFDHILGKIESRSEKIVQLYTKSSLNQREGGSEDDLGDAIDMSAVTLLIEEAKNMSVANKVKLEQLKAKYEELLLGENSQGIAKEAREIAKGLKEEIQILHDKLRAIVDEIKQARKDYNESKSTPIKL